MEISYFYLEDGGLGDGGVVSDSGDTDSDTDFDTDTDTDTDEVDAGSDSGGLGCLEGNVIIENSIDLALFSPYTCITGSLIIQNAVLSPGLTSVSLPNLEWVAGGLGVVGSSNLETIELPALYSVGGGLQVEDNDVLTELSGFDALTMVGGDLSVLLNSSLPNCEVCGLLGQLTTAPATIDVNNNLDDSCTPVPTNCP